MKYKCECLKCGHVQESDEHCRDLRCEKCGGEMRRVERPGPGQPDAGALTDILAPYPNEHAARLRDPADFDDDSFRRTKGGTIYGQVKVPGTIAIIWGKLKGKAAPADPPLPQALRFPKSSWTVRQAKEWLKEHKIRYERFEAAKAAEGSGARVLLCEAAPISFEAAGEGGESETPARFAIKAYTGGELHLDGWNSPVVVDLSGLRAPEDAIAVLLNHDRGQIVGHGQVKISADQIDIEGTVSGASVAAAQVVNSAKLGFPWRASIGARTRATEYVRAGTHVEINGKGFSGPLVVVRKAELGEVSFVPVAADMATTARIAAQTAAGNEEEADTMEFNDWLKARGFDPEALSEDQTASLRALWEQEGKEPEKDKGGETPPVKATAPEATKELREQAVAETKRIAAIHKVCAAKHPDIEAKAIEEGWDEGKAELAILRAERPKGAYVRGTGSETTPNVLEAAMCINQGLMSDKDLAAEFGADTAEQGYKLRRMGLREMCRISAQMAGRDLPHDVGSRDYIEAAFSTSNLSGILGNVANKALQKAFTVMNPVAPKIAGKASHSNFLTHTVYSLAGTGDMEEVGPDGELKHFALNEESYTRRVATRGGLLRITRQDLINDELGAFTRAADVMSRKAVVAREKALFTLINATAAGSSHFTSARGNYFEGASTNLQLSSLTTAVQMFRDQTGPDGDPVLIEPKVLLVPTAIEETGKALMDRSAALIAVALGSTSAAKKEPNANVWAGQFAVETSSYLSNSNLTGYSSTAWYLMAGPDDMPCFEIAYLNGAETPTVEYFGLDSEAGELGVTWRVYWDFGVCTAEYRAGVKSKGSA